MTVSTDKDPVECMMAGCGVMAVIAIIILSVVYATVGYIVGSIIAVMLGVVLFLGTMYFLGRVAFAVLEVGLEWHERSGSDES